MGPEPEVKDKSALNQEVRWVGASGAGKDANEAQPTRGGGHSHIGGDR